jgi:DNA-directed RNA polymerase subunit omega
MARVTVERCKFDHFELVAITAERVKQLVSGEMPTLPRDNDKNTVLAIREIEKNMLNAEELKKKIIVRNQQHSNMDDQSEEESTKQGDEGLTPEGEFGAEAHDFSAIGDIDVEGFESDNIFADDITEGEDKS